MLKWVGRLVRFNSLRRAHKVHLFGYRTSELNFSALALGKSCSG